MSNPWFKFYGAEYLSDPKIDQLSPLERSCWITLLSLANISNKNGLVENLKIFTLLTKSGIYPLDSAGEQLGLHDDYKDTLGVLEHFEALEMIERVEVYSYQVKNWEKRQETNLTEAERSKSYRDRIKKRHENVTRPVTNVTLEENRIEENRIEEGEIITPHDISKSFFEGSKFYHDYLAEFSENNNPTLIEAEFKKFVLYWNEPNGTGKKARWQLQPTFDVKRRLFTWLGKANTFSGSAKKLQPII